MPRVLGFDPGTISLDICGLEDGRVFLDRTLPTGPELGARVLEAVAQAGPIDLALGPSGYGLPLLPIADVGERELRLAFLPERDARHLGTGGDRGEAAQPSAAGTTGARPEGIEGLRALVRSLRATDLPVLFSPGVVHLPTVPAQRKVNRIDLGTADKVCAAALAIHDQATRLGVPPAETAFVLVEVGGAFTAVLAVEGGAIVDGRGGSSGSPGFLGSGALDGEVAALLGHVGKRQVFSGGAADVAGFEGKGKGKGEGKGEGKGNGKGNRDSPEIVAARADPAARAAVAFLVEGVVRAVAGELALVGAAREILLSGRLVGIPAWRAALERALVPLRPVRRVGTLGARVKEAAQGAALLADGLAGGRSAPIVESLRLREATGTALDHLYLEGAAAAARRMLE
jgi:predicted butyrate kinase (DUF1464 family)